MGEKGNVASAPGAIRQPSALEASGRHGLLEQPPGQHAPLGHEAGTAAAPLGPSAASAAHLPPPAQHGTSGLSGFAAAQHEEQPPEPPAL